MGFLIPQGVDRPARSRTGGALHAGATSHRRHSTGEESLFRLARDLASDSRALASVELTELQALAGTLAPTSNARETRRTAVMRWS